LGHTAAKGEKGCRLIVAACAAALVLIGRAAPATAAAAGIFFGPRGDYAGVELSGSANDGTANFSSVRVYCTTGC